MTPEQNNRSKTLQRVRALLEQADHPNTGEAEAAAFRSKADALMIAYAIESFELDATKPESERQKPELRTIRYDSANTEMAEVLSSAFYNLVELCRCKMGFYGWQHSKVVGFAADLDYLELLITSIQIQISNRMTPKATKSLPYAENIAMMKGAGYNWQQIYELMVPVFPEKFPEARLTEDEILSLKARFGEGIEDRYRLPDSEVTTYKKRVPVALRASDGNLYDGTMRNKRHGGKWFMTPYKNYCKDNGIDAVKINPKTYAKSFLAGFSVSLNRRIREMVDGRDAPTEGGGLVLANRDSDVMTFFYEMYPQKKPHPATCECSNCHPPKCTQKPCDRADCKKWWADARRPVRYRRAAEVRHDASAMAAGGQAARDMDLSGGRNNLGNKQKGLGS